MGSNCFAITVMGLGRATLETAQVQKVVDDLKYHVAVHGKANVSNRECKNSGKRKIRPRTCINP